MRKLMLVLAVAAVFVVALGAVAWAASPQDIYNDFAAHGKLTVDYSNADLQAYLGDAATQHYGNQTIVGDLNVLVNKLLAAEGGRGNFPFTGSELLVGFMAAFALIAGGYGLRRATRRS